MKYFKKYNTFIVEYYDADKPQEDNTKNAEENTSDKETSAKTPYDKFTIIFNNNFKYNRVEIDTKATGPNTYSEYLNKALTKLKDFIEKNTVNGVRPNISEIFIEVLGAASWVNTDYGNKGNFNYENNKKLALDRAKHLYEQVVQDISNFLKKYGYDVNKIKFTKKIRAVVKNTTSKKILNDFVKTHFENDKEALVEELRKAIKQYRPDANPDKVKIKFFKNPDADELKTRPEYEEDEKYYEILAPTKDNAEKIYDLLSNTPAYVTYTAHLESGEDKIVDKYKQEAQYSKVTITINPNAEKEDDTGEQNTTQQPDELEIRSIPFNKDASTMSGTDEYKLLFDALSKYKDNKEKILYLALTGHAESDDELVYKDSKKPVGAFNPAGKLRLLNKTSNKETYFTERQLADLRFILSVERIKAVVSKLYNDLPELTQWLLDERKIVPYPVGSTFYDKLKSKNPRIVQLTLQLNNQFKDTEPELNLFPTGVPGNKAKDVSLKLMKTLHYNVTKLYNTYLKGINFVKNKITPSYIQMTNINSVKEANKYFNFKRKFRT